MEYSPATMMVGEMMGEVTLWAGTDALTMAPQVGETITGAVMDPDGGVTGESWQWARTMDTADMNSWMDIQDATAAAYMVTAGDTGYHLRVMATYTDAAGTDMAMVYSMPTMMVTEMMGEVTDVNEAPVITGDAALNYAENGTAAVATYSATDPESATITWSLEGDDAADFEISTGGVLTFGSPPDYENPADARHRTTSTRLL